MKLPCSTIVASFTKNLMIFLLVLFFLLAVGHLLVNYYSDIHYFAFSSEKNNTQFILWRAVVYCIVVLLLTPAVLIWFVRLLHLAPKIKYQQLLRYRKVTIISIVIYELMIVQNMFKAIVQWGYYYVG